MIQYIIRRKNITFLPILSFQLLIIASICVNLYGEIKNKTAISVYGLKSIGIPQSLAESLQEHLESNLLNFSKYNVLSRNDMELILKENSLQMAGLCTEEECVVQAGHILGVKKIITGTISKVGNTYNVVLKLIDVRTAKLESSVNQKHSGSIDTLLDIIENSLQTLLNEKENKIKDKEKIAKLKAEVEKLQNHWEIEKSKVVQLQQSRNDLEEKKQKLEKMQQLYQQSRRIDSSGESIKIQSEKTTKRNISFDTKFRNSDTTNSMVKPTNQREILEENINNSTKYRTSNKKKGKIIGIGALALLGSIAISVFVYQVSSSK